MDEFELELKRDFLAEASMGLEQAEQAFLALESDPNNPDLLNQIFRLAHNLKGTSRAVGFGQIAEFTHSFENLILKIKEGAIAPTAPVVSLLLRGNDRVSQMINDLKANIEATFENTAMIAEFEDAIAGKLGDAPAPAPAATATAAADAPIAPVIPITSASAAPEAPSGPIVVNNRPKAATADENLRVSLEKIESLNNLVGELVLIQSVLAPYAAELRSEVATKSLQHLTKLSKELHEAAMSLRMVPMKQTLQKMQRIVRDTSQALGKTVELVILGEDTEVDKTVLEHLGDPLVHIVRNAVDHGLEATADRAKVGKSEAGRVTIRCFHEGNFLVIEIGDDGKGMDPAVLRTKAIGKGLIPENSTMSDREAINLIFHPGFSTKEQVSEISGRGVGMDVVRTNIQGMNGTIEIDSIVGKGSTFRINLPLTLAVIDGLVAGIGSEKYVLPLTQVHEILRVDQGRVDQLADKSEVFTLRGKAMPFHRLNSTLRRQPTEEVTDPAVVITRAGGREYGVLVDKIFHQQQIVVKTLGPEIQNQRAFMGSSILGDGKPALILDLHKLYNGSLTA